MTRGFYAWAYGEEGRHIDGAAVVAAPRRHPRPNRTFDPAKERHRDVAILTGLVALVVIALGVGLIVGSTEVRWAANSFAAVTLLLTLVLAWSYRRG